MSYDLSAIVSNFQIYGHFPGAEPYGSGYINNTIEVKTGLLSLLNLKTYFQRSSYPLLYINRWRTLNDN
jgi:hypothetical protein